jgi:hypothetical protein
MPAPLMIALLFAAAPDRVGIRMEDAQGLLPEEAQRLARAFGRSVELVTGAVAVIDDRTWEADCARADRCAQEVLARTGASEVVFLKAFGTATRVRVIADRAGGEVHSVQADLGKEPDSWGGSLHGCAEILFPGAVHPTMVEPGAAPPSATPPATTAIGSRASEPVPIWTWSMLGAGGAAVVAAAVLRVNANGLRDKIANMPLDPPTLASDENSVRTQGTASNVLFGTAAALIVGGAVYLLTH